MGNFGNTVKAKRLVLNLTSKQFIEKLDHKISGSYMSAIEMHEAIPSKALMMNIAKVLDIDYNLLIKAAKQDRSEKALKAIENYYE